MSIKTFLLKLSSFFGQIIRIGCLSFLLSLILFNNGRAYAETIYTRQSIFSSSWSGNSWSNPNVNCLKAGISRMQSRSDTNPTSWIYQANIHGVPSGGSAIAWNTCAHGSYFFPSWHRMYLYYFERILRKAAVDVLGSQCQNLALPYWDYSFNNADQRKLPVPFRTPADPSNVLYVKERNDGINAGASMPSADVNYTQAFQKLNFTSPIGDGNSFGGQRRTDAPHGATPHSVFESRPHDQVHVDVGGWMSQVNRAARDPIFWLHHANIDRLWESWVKLGGGRQNPTTDSDWMNKSFTFFDENGNQVQMRGSQILNTVTQLNYQYSSLAQIPLNVSESMSGDTPKDLIQLGRERVVLPVPSGEIIREAPRRGVSIKLKIEGVEYDPSNLIPYDIYINLPEGATPDPESPYYVGKLALFAYPQGETFTIDITEKVRELQERNVITGDDTKLTIVPSNLVSREQIEERLGRNRSQGNVTFKKVTITVE